MPEEIKPTPVADKPVHLAPSPSSGVPHPSKPVPEEIAKTEFKDDFTGVDDFHPEQLPVRTPTEAEQKILDEKKAVKEAKPTKEVTDVKLEIKPTDEKKTEETPQFPKYLKPPKDGKVEKETTKGTGKEVIKPIVPTKIVRDYSGHSSEEVAAFKQMSDEGYALTKKLIQENRELAKLKDTTYLQHENAYVLDPQFQSLQVDASYAQREGDYWKEQLVLMQTGKAWKPILKWDENGNPVVGPERQPTTADEEQVRLFMSTCYNNAQQIKGKLQEYPTKYQSTIQSDLQAVDIECKRRFSWEQDPKLLEYSLPIEYEDGVRDVSIKQIREDFASLFPVYLRNHPAVRVGGNLMVALRIGYAELAEIKGNKQVEQTISDEASRVEPSSAAKPAQQKAPVHGITEFKDLPSDLA